MKAASQLAPSPIRLPQELEDWLKHRAIDNRRSFSSEVLVRLEQSRQLHGGTGRAPEQPTEGRKATSAPAMAGPDTFE